MEDASYFSVAQISALVTHACCEEESFIFLIPVYQSVVDNDTKCLDNDTKCLDNDTQLA